MPAVAGLVAAAVMPAQPFVPDPFGPEPQSQTKVVRAFTGGGSYLGIGLQEIDGERAKALKLKHEEGVEITWVEDESPAAKAGLKKGDVVLQFNGQHVEGIEQFSRMVRETPAGRDVKLLVSREGAQQTIAAKVGSPQGGHASRDAARGGAAGGNAADAGHAAILHDVAQRRVGRGGRRDYAGSWPSTSA